VEVAKDERRISHDRRVTSAHLHAPERRTGFDRRRTYPVLGVFRDDPRLFAYLVLSVVALSIADGALTAYELGVGIAEEGNPVLGALISAHPALAVAFKLVMTLLVAWGIWHGRRYRLIIAVGLGAFFTYGLLIAYHLGALSGLGII